jgi:uncharacterized protein
MRVIITGGFRLTGRRLALDLLQEGHEIVLLTTTLDKDQKDSPTGARLVQWDGKTANGWWQEAEGADAIVNLAGENIFTGRWTEKRKKRILESRVNAGKAVVEAVERVDRKPSVVIQSSGINYYGPKSGEKQVIEKTPPGKDFLANVCIEWEMSTVGVEKYGVRRPIVRQGVVLAREDGALPKMALPYRFFVGGPVGSGRQWFSWIHLTDNVRAIRFLIENGRANGPFNLCSPSPVTNRRFSKILGKVLRRPSFIPVPAFVLKLILGEMSTVLLEGQRAVPKRLQELGYKFQFPEIEPSLRNLFDK